MKFRNYKMQTEQIKKIYEDLLDMPIHKIHYVLIHIDLLKALFTTVNRYNVNLTEEVFDIFLSVLNFKLEGSYDIETEFEEKEYINLIKIKTEEFHAKEHISGLSHQPTPSNQYYHRCELQ